MTTGNREVVRSRPGDISNYENHTHLPHINSVHSGFFYLNELR